MDLQIGGLFGLIVLALDIWAIVNVLGSGATTTGGKVLWILLVLLLPVVGIIIWLIVGPRGRTAAV